MKEKYIEDIREIKQIMNRSTRFISLSGLSGVSTGIIALVGAYLAYLTVFKGQDYLTYASIELTSEILLRLLLVAGTTLVFSIGSAVYFTRQKSMQSTQDDWDKQSIRLLVSLAIPLITGGILCLMLLFKGFIGLLPPLTLLFYGLALVNGSKHSLVDIRILGFIQIIIGLIALQFITLGLWFWAFGFGIVQMVYGILVQKKYK